MRASLSCMVEASLDSVGSQSLQYLGTLSVQLSMESLVFIAV